MTAPGGEVSSLQEKMMSDKEIMSLIQSLQNDSEFQRILEDPEVMKAVNSGDIAALMANARFMKLFNNSTLREIQSKVK
jgi:Tfp pilus assembly ATPase PilU